MKQAKQSNARRDEKTTVSALRLFGLTGKGCVVFFFFLGGGM